MIYSAIACLVILTLYHLWAISSDNQKVRVMIQADEQGFDPSMAYQTFVFVNVVYVVLTSLPLLYLFLVLFGIY